MNGLLLGGIITLGTLLIVGVVLGITLSLIRRLAGRREADFRERFPDARLVIGMSNFFGQQSRGVGQVRGNGTLALTDSELVFEMWLLRREFRIPLYNIQAVERVSSHLGKTVGRPMVKVTFSGDGGQPDSMAWWVADVDGLIRAIEEARK